MLASHPRTVLLGAAVVIALATLAAANSVQVEVGAAVGAGASSSSEATLSRRARAGLISLPSLPSLDDVKKKVFSQMKDKFSSAIGSLGNTNSLTTALNNAKDTVSTSLTNMGNEAGKWATDTVNSQVNGLGADVDDIKDRMKKELATVRHAIDTAKNGLKDMVNTLADYAKSAVTISVRNSCQLPNVLSQSNQLMKEYANMTMISRDQWCTMEGFIAKFDAKAANVYAKKPGIAVGASLIEELHAIRTIRTTSFMEMTTTHTAQVGVRSYNCDAMMRTSRAFDGLMNIGNMFLGAIDQNVDKKVQPAAYALAIIFRVFSIMMRSMCAASEDLDSCKFQSS